MTSCVPSLYTRSESIERRFWSHANTPLLIRDLGNFFSAPQIVAQSQTFTELVQRLFKCDAVQITTTFTSDKELNLLICEMFFI